MVSSLKYQRVLLISCKISLTSSPLCFSLSLFWSQVEVLRMFILPKHQKTQFKKVFFAWKGLAFCKCQGLSRINNAFVLGVHEERRGSNRLQQWCGISKQLLNEWQSQGLMIWTWENPEGAPGEEAAAADEPVKVRQKLKRKQVVNGLHLYSAFLH